MFNSLLCIQIYEEFHQFGEGPSRHSTVTRRSSSTSRSRSFTSDWDIDPQAFEVYLAVPDSEKEERKEVKYSEHVYTVEEEDLALGSPNRRQ